VLIGDLVGFAIGLQADFLLKYLINSLFLGEKA
jgi:hypothetical protein